MAEHMLGLPLKHKMKDIKGLIAELETFFKLNGSRYIEGNVLPADLYSLGSAAKRWNAALQNANLYGGLQVQESGVIQFFDNSQLQLPTFAPSYPASGTVNFDVATGYLSVWDGIRYLQTILGREGHSILKSITTVPPYYPEGLLWIRRDQGQIKAVIDQTVKRLALYEDIPAGLAREHVTLLSDGAGVTWANMPVAETEFLGAAYHRQAVDMSSAAYIRIMINVISAGASGACIGCQWSNNGGLTWNWFNSPTSPYTVIDSPGFGVSAWYSMITGSKVDGWIRLVGWNGDGKTDPVFGNIAVEFR